MLYYTRSTTQHTLWKDYRLYVPYLIQTAIYIIHIITLFTKQYALYTMHIEHALIQYIHVVPYALHTMYCILYTRDYAM